MENERFTLEYFCRLCASEGVIIHPLFPPGDNDPKDELVRMIDVLTSVHLTRADDAGAVICDKCLQMLDLFCRFREECLRQDVLIRTKRTLICEELVRQQLLLEQQRAETELLLRQQQVEAELLKQQTPPETVKLEDDNDGAQVEKLGAIATPHAAESGECKEEFDSEEVSEGNESQQNVQQDSDDIATGDDDEVEERIEESSLSNDPSYPPSNGIALLTPAGSLSISVQVNQMSLGEPTTDSTETTPSGTVMCDGNTSPIPSVAQQRTVRRTKPNLNKPPPGCDICQESFATHYEYEQHMDQLHAWDKNSRSSLACDPCQMRFTKSYNLKRHMYEVHGELSKGMTVTPCPLCGERFLRGYILERHIAKMHRNKKKLKIIAIK
ncbi:zinc finger and BTB domain-containing protein 44-like [Anopheles ziemanni]|uniref:zinc finger and BTB domain-containing protein 44-like n=1 Tax=Anopheles coustani TaxID=139045 RepID=UPI002657E2F4|nr:zinc finger and BTB domain-containing protein 44-like [Anopheles coustani]XP_058174124.1 zinc finger and BTB domain-containing protein 44-like [Anopheles ziemanni]